jgi:hypothetical protein
MKTQSLIPVQGVVVHREGKSVRPPVGQPFEFTEGEVADIRAVEKANKTAILREPVNEIVVDEKAAKIKAAAEKALKELVAKAEAAAKKAEGKAADGKEAKAAAEAKDAVRTHCENTGLDLPAGYEAGEL